MKIGELARRLGRKPTTIHHWIKSGLIPNTPLPVIAASGVVPGCRT